MSRYDASRASDLVLMAAVRAALGSPPRAALESFVTEIRSPFGTTTRRCLEAFASVLLDDPSEDFQELAALRAECRLKTRAEYDREIGDLLRAACKGLPPCEPLLGVNANWPRICSLLDASRSAPEGEP